MTYPTWDSRRRKPPRPSAAWLWSTYRATRLNSISGAIATIWCWCSGSWSERLCLKLRECLRPGGLLVYKTYTDEQPRFWERPNPRHLLQSNELLHAFPDFRVLHYRETLIEQGVAELVAQKIRA